MQKYIEAHLVSIPTEDLIAPMLMHKVSKTTQFFDDTNWSNSNLTKAHLFATIEELEPKVNDWYLCPINCGGGGFFVKDSLAQFKETDSVEDYIKLGARKVVASTHKSFFIEEGNLLKKLPEISYSDVKEYCLTGVDKVFIRVKEEFTKTKCTNCNNTGYLESEDFMKPRCSYCNPSGSGSTIKQMLVPKITKDNKVKFNKIQESWGKKEACDWALWYEQNLKNYDGKSIKEVFNIWNNNKK